MHKKPLGIFGGTFDPVHLGHLHVGETIYRQLNFAEIRFIPCYQPVHRPATIASAEDRLAMLRLAINNKPGLIVDDREIKRQGPSYMIDTLISLRNEFPNSPLCLILATDAFIDFNRWHRWQEIFNYAHLVVVKRREKNWKENSELTQFIKPKQIHDPQLLHQKLAESVFFIDINSLPISGTQIRQQIAMGKAPKNLLPKGVWEYIQKHHLYTHNDGARCHCEER